jgi:ferrochelatase
MTMDGVREAAGVILSPFRSEPSWDRYIQVVEESRRSIGPGAPVVHYLDPWHENPFFIEALADRITEAQAPFSPERQQNAHWIFTAHSIPVALDHASGYSRQIARAAEMTANLLGHKEWTSAYQSRSGRPEDAWLEPDIGDVLRSLSGSSKKDVVAIPIGFVMDHVEVLYDLDIKAREAAVSAGLHFLRAKTVGTHQSFLRVLSDGIRRTLKLSETSPLPG